MTRLRTRIADKLVLAVATGLFLSYIPFKFFRRLRFRGRGLTGAGWVGSLLGLALLGWLPRDPVRLAAFLAAGLAGSVWVAHRAGALLGAKDDPRIVVDEVVGYWFTMAGLPMGPLPCVAGLLLFRIYDVLKLPLPAAERLPGGLGVVADDVLAGAAANLSLRLLWEGGRCLIFQ